MYAHFYQLSEDPFNLTPDPKFQYINESTREAMAAILHGVKSRKGFITLIGDAGTGKTTLLKRIVDEIEGETGIVFVFNPGVSFDELLEFICMELGIRTEGCGRLQLLERLNEYLLEQLTSGRNVVVMIDEAQTLDDGVLEELRLLSNLETAKEKILQILLSGQTELEEKLRRPGLRQLRQRIAVRTTLKPVRNDEIAAYVETRLRSAGAARGDFFTPAALKKVWRASKGIPRVVNVICDNAMMLAFAEGKKRITGAVMNDAVRDLNGRTVGQDWTERLRDWLMQPGLRYAGAAVVAFALVVPFALSMLSEDGLRSLMSDDEGQAVEVVAANKELQPPAVAAPVPSPAALPFPLGRAFEPGTSAAVPAEEKGMETSPWGDRYSDGELYPTGPHYGAELEAGRRRSVMDSMRRAELLARSTAARLYDSRRRGSLAGGQLDVEGVGSPARTESSGAVAAARGLRAKREEAAKNQAETKREESVEGADTAASGEDPALADATESLADATESLAEALESLASEPVELPRVETGGANILGPAAGQPLVGELVRIMPGDSVWALASEHYGTAGPVTLKRILDANPGIRNPRRLDIGDHLFLPFSKPDRMVTPDRRGGYRVLLSSSPNSDLADFTAAWLKRVIPGAVIETEASGGPEARYRLYATGLASREAAMAAASRILGEYSRLRGRRGRAWEPATGPRYGRS